MSTTHKFSEEQIDRAAHAIAMKYLESISPNKAKELTGSYIDKYTKISNAFEKYNQTGRLPEFI